MILSVVPKKMAVVSLLALAGVAMLSDSINDLGTNLNLKLGLGRGQGQGRFLTSSAAEERRLASTDYELVGKGFCINQNTTQTFLKDAGDPDFTEESCRQKCGEAYPSCISFEWSSTSCTLYDLASTETTGPDDPDGIGFECYNFVTIGLYQMQQACDEGCFADPHCDFSEVIVEGYITLDAPDGTSKTWPNSYVCVHKNIDGESIGSYSDPLISGLQGQIFKFDGRSDAWYANIASKSLHHNVHFHTFDTCPKGENTFVTGSSITLLDPNPTHANGAVQSLDNIFVSVQQQDIFANAGIAALGGGNLVIKLGDQDIVTPGDYTLRTAKGDIRVVAHNTYAACSRKWYDYDHKPYAASVRGEDLPATGRRRLSLRKVRQPIDYLVENKDAWIDSAECTKWIEERKKKNDLFQQVGDWSTIYIESPLITYQIELRQNKVDNNESCAYASLDTYITEMSPELEAEDFRGILGETKVKKFDYGDGATVMLHRSDALEYENDEAYEVDGPFGFAFEAREPRAESDVAVEMV